MLKHIFLACLSPILVPWGTLRVVVRSQQITKMNQFGRQYLAPASFSVLQVINGVSTQTGCATRCLAKPEKCLVMRHEGNVCTFGASSLLKGTDLPTASNDLLVYMPIKGDPALLVTINCL